MDANTACTATSSMIVDLSGDNDNIGAITAANSLPKTSEDSPFERSCDNPECSAPRLISLVPKRETAEFVTEPTVINQPTLVNGFTTVFQVDGLAAKINDIMNGNYKGSVTADGYGDQSKPKTVFRIVPNTHAHIVNYVVVDGAGETLRKIKSNDPDTMQKLLDSQRLSAEQMLKKLISKAFQTSSRKADAPMPLPIPSKVPGYSHLGVPLQDTPTDPAAIPPVPSGITITPVVPDQLTDPLVIDINHKELAPKANAKAVVTQTAGTATKSTPTVATQNKVTSKGTGTTTTPTSKSVSVQAASVPKTTPQTSTTTTALTSKKGSSPSTTTSKETTPAPAKPLPILPTKLSKAEPFKPNILKRKQTPSTSPEVIKRLRPRSPKQRAPLAVGLDPPSTFTPPTRKLPMLPKLPTRPPPGTTDSPAPAPAKVSTPAPTAKEAPSTRSMEIAKAFASCLEEPEMPMFNEEFTVKVRPITGPASKVKPPGAPQNTKTTLAAKVSAALAANTGVTKIGETVITATSKSKDDKSSSSPAQPKPTEPSLSTNVEGKKEFLQKEAALKTPPPAPTSHSTTVLTQVSKLTSSGPKIIAQTKTNLTPIKMPHEPDSPEKDPLAFDDFESSSLATPRPVTSLSKPDTAPLTRSGKTKSTPKEADAPSEKLPTLPTLPDAKARQIKTRAAVPKAATATASGTPQGKASTPSATPTRSLRVMVPVLRSGIMTIPVRSPHPNLKISSVMSGGSVVTGATYKSPTKLSHSEQADADIDKLQQELADLRRTVQRLSKRKP